MWFTPWRSRTSRARSASSWLARASAAAPNRVTVLEWPVRPKGRCSIMGRSLLSRSMSPRQHSTTRAGASAGRVAILSGMAIERRRMGRTDMTVSALGFGGSEIGYQRASARTVERILLGALDDGLNVVDTAECYEDS